jgi:hypothetical protein
MLQESPSNPIPGFYHAGMLNFVKDFSASIEIIM